MRKRFISRVVNALAVIDACNDFGDYARSAIRVPGGNAIGPVIGELQVEGHRTHFFHKQLNVRDAHKPNMFSFREARPDLVKMGINRVADRGGVLHTLLPRHMIPGTWGWELLRGIHENLFDAHFRKGEELDLDQFSAATPEVISWLRQNGITDVYLTGHVRRICVGTTAIKLADSDFNVHLVEDATGDVDLPLWKDVLVTMDQMGVEKITKAQLLERMHQK